MERQANPKSLAAILATVAVAEFMLVLDVSIVNVALPSMRRDLGFSESGLQWVVNAYALLFGGFLLLGGRAADLYGGRKIFTRTLGLFALASLACGFAPNGGFLVGSRAVQGFAAALLSPATLSILTANFEGRERKRAIAVWSAVAIGGGAVGALLGGVLTEWISWRWIFFVNVPVGLALLLAAFRSLPREKLQPRRRLDLLGAVLVTGALLALVLALVRSTEIGWSSWETLLPLLGGLALLGLFLVVEWRIATEPLVPLKIFRSRAIAVGNLLMFSSFMAVVATWFFLTLYLQLVRGYSPIEAGLFFVPVSLAVIAASQLGFRATGAVDGRVIALLGGLIAAAGLLFLGRVGTGSSLWYLLVPALVAMSGSGLIYAPITIASTAQVDAEFAGLASGLLNATRQLGGAFGLAVLATVAVGETNRMSDAPHLVALTSGYRFAFDGGALIFFAAGLLGLLLLPSLKGAKDQGDAPDASSPNRESASGEDRPRDEDRAAA